MKYLLDTHAIIWYMEESSELPQEITALIDNPVMDVCICAISLWEIAIKMNLGKLEIKLTLDELLAYVKTREFRIINIEDEHLLSLHDLPYIHKDPFDRLLVATAITEGLTIITIDENIHKYDVSWVWKD